MAADLIYTGTTLNWLSQKKTYKATSGLIGTQRAKFQIEKDHGPIPEGRYQLLAKDVGTAKSKNGDLVTGNEGIEALPPNPFLLEQWGPHRVFLKILEIKPSKAKKRSGFYLHDSEKGFTHGCIEVEARFFTDLRTVALTHPGPGVRIEVQVKYLSAESSTNGGTAHR